MPLQTVDWKKWLAFLIMLALLAGGGYWYYTQSQKPVVTVKTIKVERGDVAATVSATGTLVPLNKVDVSSKITGLITKVLVKENDFVQQGQILIELDDKQLQSDMEQTRAKLKNALLNHQRNQELLRQGAISTQQADQTETDYLVAQATYDNSLSKIEDTVIRAPINGVVIGKPIPAGQTVAPGISTPMVLLTVAELSVMQIETLVDESDIGRIAVGQNVTFTVDSFPNLSFAGVVTNVSMKSVVQQNVVYYTVLVDVADTQGKLFPSMTARVSIHVGESKNVLLLPLSALREKKGQKYATVQRANGTTEDVPVEIGLMGDDKVEVRGALVEGDNVVTRSAAASGSCTNAPATTRASPTTTSPAPDDASSATPASAAPSSSTASRTTSPTPTSSKASPPTRPPESRACSGECSTLSLPRPPTNEPP